MRHRSTRFIAISLFALVFGSFGVATSEDSRTLSGSYRWVDGGSGDLTAEFRPDGEGAWRVKFRFEFSGDRKAWGGTAAGTLEDGTDVTGTARWKSRRWTWTATVVDGVMRGRHSEILPNGDAYETGTFEIRR